MIVGYFHKLTSACYYSTRQLLTGETRVLKVHPFSLAIPDSVPTSSFWYNRVKYRITLLATYMYNAEFTFAHIIILCMSIAQCSIIYVGAEVLAQ